MEAEDGMCVDVGHQKLLRSENLQKNRFQMTGSSMGS